jgi:hypothetical protein
MSDWVCVRTFRDRIAAEAGEAVLRGAGIEASIRADDAGGAAPYIAYTTGGARLMVRNTDAARAQELLQDVQG